MIFLLVVMKTENFCENHDFNGSTVNDEFDRPISADEVLKAVKKIKNQ